MFSLLEIVHLIWLHDVLILIDLFLFITLTHLVILFFVPTNIYQPQLSLHMLLIDLHCHFTFYLSTSTDNLYFTYHLQLLSLYDDNKPQLSHAFVKYNVSL